MNKRPLYVTIIGCVYIVTGAVGCVNHFRAFPLEYDTVLAELISLIAIVSGVFMLRGRNWARWLALAWIAFHVILSAFHTLREFAIHSLICAILAYFLYRPAATRYFRSART